jgi:hypothetical protein
MTDMSRISRKGSFPSGDVRPDELGAVVEESLGDAAGALSVRASSGFESAPAARKALAKIALPPVDARPGLRFASVFSTLLSSLGASRQIRPDGETLAGPAPGDLGAAAPSRDSEGSVSALRLSAFLGSAVSRLAELPLSAVLRPPFALSEDISGVIFSWRKPGSVVTTALSGLLSERRSALSALPFSVATTRFLRVQVWWTRCSRSRVSGG